MSAQGERPYGLLSAVGRFSTFVMPFLIAFEVWQTKELMAVSKAEERTAAWRDGVGDRMRTESEKLRLEIMATVQGTIGVALVEIQKSQIRTELAIEELKRRIGKPENEHANNSR